MALNTRYERTRGQSETVGVILLTAVIVVLIAGFSVTYLGVLDDRSNENKPLLDATITATDERVSVTHAGGESIPLDELDVLVRGDDVSERHPFDAMNPSGNRDARFDPADRFSRNHSVGGGQLEVLVIHTASNAVLQQAYLDTVDDGDRDGNGPPTADFKYSPSEPGTGETVMFDASAATGVGGVARYEWDWNGDGTIDESGSEPTVDHAFATAGSYDVTLTVVDGEDETDEVTRSITVGEVPPTIESTSLTDGDDDLVTSGDSMSVSATVAAGSSEVDTVVADASAFDAGGVVLSDDNDDGTYDATFDVGQAAQEGEQSVMITATDLAGNAVSTDTADTVTVDMTAPAIETFAVDDESENELFWFIESFRIQWSASDERLAETTISVDRSGATREEYTGPSGDETYENVRLFSSSGREHAISIVATDAAGNRACRTVTDVADGTGPSESAFGDC